MGRAVKKSMVDKNEKKLPNEFIEFLDTLIYSTIIDMEYENTHKSLKILSTHFKGDKKFGIDFYLGYYTGLLVGIISFTFFQKYDRQPDKEEFDEILDIIGKKSIEIEKALKENNIVSL